MNPIEILVADHAEFSDEHKRLKLLTSAELDKCSRREEHNGSNCIEAAYQECLRMNAEEGDPLNGVGWEFEEVLEVMEPCDHCQRARELKRARVKIGRRLGGIRSQLTKIGRRLREEGRA